MKFDRIITDMGRAESGRFNSTAGIDLIRKIREKDKEIPIIVSCSKDAVRKYADEALTAGANAITSSPSVVLSSLNLRT